MVKRKKTHKTAKRKPKSKVRGICQFPECSKSAVKTCKYCKREFCAYHVTPTIATSLREISTLNNDSDTEAGLKAELLTSWKTKEGHADSKYSAIRRRYWADRTTYRTTITDGVTRYDRFRGDTKIKRENEDKYTYLGKRSVWSSIKKRLGF